MSIRVHVLATLCAAFALTAGQACAADGAQAALDFGCLNCHGAQTRSAPTFRSMADKAARRGEPEKALQHLLEEMHEKDEVHAHLMVSDDAARAVMQWVAHGMK